MSELNKMFIKGWINAENIANNNWIYVIDKYIKKENLDVEPLTEFIYILHIDNLKEYLFDIFIDCHDNFMKQPSFEIVSKELDDLDRQSKYKNIWENYFDGLNTYFSLWINSVETEKIIKKYILNV